MPGSVKLLPSDPVTVIAVALVAATVSVEAVPAVTEAGLAEIVTVGATFVTTVREAAAEAVPPGPLAVAV